jgi:hypothetical protein
MMTSGRIEIHEGCVVYGKPGMAMLYWREGGKRVDDLSRSPRLILGDSMYHYIDYLPIKGV